MSQHITRKELKKDEIRDTIAHGAEAVISHQKLLGIGIGIAVVVVAAVLGWRFYSERQTVKASVAFEDAMKVFQARIRTAGEPVDPGEVTYFDEKIKYEDAARKFTEVAGKYSRTSPGQMARYYAALSLEHLGRYDEAQKWLREMQSGGNEAFASLARYQLAQVLEKTGKSGEAAELYRQLMEKPSTFVPRSFAMLALADQLSKSNPAEAAKLYNQIKQDFPDTAVADEVDKRLAALKL